MLCCYCRKKQATKTYRREVGGKRLTEYYCADCYDRLFIGTEAEIAPARGGTSARQIAVCPYCGETEEEFLSSGLLGCPHCYQSLAAIVMPAIVRMQGREIHCGERPKNSGEQEDLVRRRNKLKKNIETLVKEKKYEAASYCSKELKTLNDILYEREERR